MRIKFKFDDLAIRLYLFALVIITLVPFGRGSISGLEPAVPFLILSFVIFAMSKNILTERNGSCFLCFFCGLCGLLQGLLLVT